MAAAQATPQPSKAGNIIIFLIGAAIVCWMMHGQVVKPLERQRAGLEDELKVMQERAQAGKNMVVKNSNLKSEQDTVLPIFTATAQIFPDTGVDSSKISGVLDTVTKDLPAHHVNILKAPPLKKADLWWQSNTMQPEDLTGPYKNLVGENAIKPLGDKATISTKGKFGKFEQEWELEAEWESFPTFLVKLSQLPVYFEITQLDVYSVLDPAMRKDYRLPKTGAQKPPKRVKVKMVVAAIAFSPLPTIAK